MISNIISFITKLFIWMLALIMIAICSIIFFAMYGLYLLINAVLYGTNLVIYGLNMIVSPIAKAIKSMVDGVNSAINAIKKVFDDIKRAWEELVNFFKRLKFW